MTDNGLIKKAKNPSETQQATIFYDVFGGSGIISHTLKYLYPHNRVVWNDYDNYQERLDNTHITEQVRQELLNILPSKEVIRLTPAEKEAVIKLLDSYQYLDTITLATYLCFSGNYAQDRESLYKIINYQRVNQSPIITQNYLKGVERVSLDFKTLLDSIPQEQKDNQQAFLILDPPYLQTFKGNYSDSFSLKQFFSLFESITKPYIFFSSENSDILEFLEFFSKYNKTFENYTFNTAFLKCLGTTERKLDYMIYTEPENLLTSLSS